MTNTLTNWRYKSMMTTSGPPLKVLNHRSKKHYPTGNSVVIHIQWLNEDTSRWVTIMVSVRLQDAMVLIKYAIPKRLCQLDEWAWVDAGCLVSEEVNLLVVELVNKVYPISYTTARGVDIIL